MKILALLPVALFATALFAGEKYSSTEKFDRTCVVAPNVEISLRNINGSVEIIGWDKNEVAIVAEKRAASAEDLAKIHINVDASDKSVSISTDFERTGWFRRNVNGEVIYKVHVPASAVLHKVDVVNSSISIERIQGDVDAATVNGSIQARALAGTVELSTVNGGIELALADAPQHRSIRVKSVNGRCQISVPAAFAGSFSASTINGKIVCDLPLSNLKAGRTSLSGQLGNSDANSVEAKSVNGGITLNVL
jgi:DUF4097 and DUF4098 domain-containing protein YvlB